MDSNFSKIEDSEDLIKDNKSRAVVNNDSDAYFSYRSRKKKNKQISKLVEEVEDLKKRIYSLENLINNSNN